MWTPFLKPGEWTPPTTTTPKPVVVSVTTPAPAIAAAKKKIANPAFMFGIKFPGQSDMDIFIPDNLPVEVKFKLYLIRKMYLKIKQFNIILGSNVP